jgi:hypothetical protein
MIFLLIWLYIIGGLVVYLAVEEYGTPIRWRQYLLTFCWPVAVPLVLIFYKGRREYE